MSSYRVDSSGTTAVDPDYHYRKIDGATPLGVVMLLINKASGVSVKSLYYHNAPFTHWSPLPTFDEEET